MIQLDYPRLRQAYTCPICHQPKDWGCIVCWPCYRQHEGRHNFTPAIRAILDAWEEGTP